MLLGFGASSWGAHKFAAIMWRLHVALWRGLKRICHDDYMEPSKLRSALASELGSQALKV